MEKFNSEELISSLIVSGYNKVDLLLCNLVINHIKNDESISAELSFDEKGLPSGVFNDYVLFEDYTYSIGSKKLTDEVEIDGNNTLLVGDVLPLNEKLIKYLINTDLTDLIIEKAKLIGVDNLYLHADLFSNREINVVRNVFGKNVFGELYAYIDELHFEDYKNMTDEEIYDLMKNFKNTNFIYRYCLNDHQRQISSFIISRNSNYSRDLPTDSVDDILEAYKNKGNDSSVLLSICDAFSRVR